MNAHNAKDYLPLVQALSEGKQLQVEIENEPGAWVDTNSPLFDRDAKFYRVKPEAREVWLLECSDRRFTNVHTQPFTPGDGYKCVHFREVV